ncbi:translation initiation factor IF-2 [Drosophila virilis]|uniref:Protein TsetseEP domain-containing protein n=1 Tax=Drosophila virilis TaxID=7244 RepID=B4LJY8_DROVI|nr:protein TsetseEP [Drosophila virilis]EDW61642.1 uncharacterized protein Dvir_GJ20197 [Drosophila virilis]
MQLFTRVLLLAVTVLGASAWPRMADESSLLRMVMAQLSSPLAISRAASPAETACVNRYTNATYKISEELANATSKCEEAANRTVVANAQNANATVAQIRAQHLSLEKNLQQCNNETDSQRLINCTVSTFDKNLQLLDSSNTLAYQTQSQFATNSTIVATQRTSCISVAVDESKVKSIEAANEFNSCMAKVPSQRELPVEHEPERKELAQTQPEQKPEKQPEQKPEQRPEQKPDQPLAAQQPAN